MSKRQILPFCLYMYTPKTLFIRIKEKLLKFPLLKKSIVIWEEKLELDLKSGYMGEILEGVKKRKNLSGFDTFLQ